METLHLQGKKTDKKKFEKRMRKLNEKVYIRNENLDIFSFFLFVESIFVAFSCGILQTMNAVEVNENLVCNSFNNIVV